MSAQIRRFVEKRIIELEAQPILKEQRAQICITLPAELHEKFDRLSRYHGLSKAEQITDFVERAPELLERETELEFFEDQDDELSPNIAP